MVIRVKGELVNMGDKDQFREGVGGNGKTRQKGGQGVEKMVNFSLTTFKARGTLRRIPTNVGT